MHIHQEDLDMYICGGSSPSVDINVELHLPACGSCKTALADTLEFRLKVAELKKAVPERQSSRRREVRIATDEPAQMRRLNPFSSGLCDVRVVNVSGGGLKLLAPYQVIAGTIIQVRLGAEVIFGEVRYCAAHDANFYLGVQIHDTFPTMKPAN